MAVSTAVFVCRYDTQPIGIFSAILEHLHVINVFTFVRNTLLVQFASGFLALQLSGDFVPL